MKKKKAYILLALLVISLNFSYAQKSETGNWFIYFGNQQISKKWNWWNEVQYRNYNFAGDMQQLLLRTGIGINLSENNNNLLLGYGFIRSRNYVAGKDSTVSSNEHRLYQQFITKQSFGRFFIQHRYRVEERFIQEQFKMRFRYFLALNVPLNNQGMGKGSVYASAYNEIFLNAESPLFDRNRLYGGLGYVFNKNFRAEIGFMNQSLENTGRNQFQFVLFNSLPLYKEN